MNLSKIRLAEHPHSLLHVADERTEFTHTHTHTHTLATEVNTVSTN